MSSFFHTIVVFGASAALTGCGGNAVDSTGTPDKEAGGASGSGVGGSPAQGAGGRGMGGVTFGVAGSVNASGGHMEQGDAASVVIPDTGTLAQWNCGYAGGCIAASQGGSGVVNQGINILEPCAIDPTRPRSAADCRSDQWFACDLGYYLGIAVHVQCACTDRDDGGCASLCNPYDANTYPLRETALGCIENVKICGCAYAHTGITR